ncbi:MAG TPA: DUF1015 domain-containing protein [Candidatus Eremiobacteraceae bacterium]|nr:DUF1015 domain-containing protein [Candidatus Eremiobacteraceae bacterium]
MAQLQPFRAFRYNPERVSFQQVLTQPYDKISPEMQSKYYAADPHNLITVEKGRAFPTDNPGNNVYTRAAAAVNDWIQKRVVVQDPAPSFYAYSQEFTVPGTRQRATRHGFIGLGKLEEYSAGMVFRHEHTLSGPKADRLELLRHTNTHTGQLFMLYSDPARKIDQILLEVETQNAPATEIRDEYDVVHRLWVISDPQRVAEIQKAMADQKLVIADGHHRYETALNYRNELRSRAGKTDPAAVHENAMMTFVNTRSAGLLILPTHRVVANLQDFSWNKMLSQLEPWFSSEVFSFSSEAEKTEARNRFLARLSELRAQRAIGVYPAAQAAKRAFYILSLRPGADLTLLLPDRSALQRNLDVVLLHEGILQPILGITPQSVAKEANLTYEREASAALDAVDRGAAQIAFLLNPVAVEEVMTVATAGEVMPQKSTDFFPKLMSGITMCRLVD